MKILHIDIETAPHKSYHWGLWNQNIQTVNIVEPGYTLCWAAKWHEKRKVYFDSVNDSTPKKMIQSVHELLDEADVVCHYNGQKFDVPMLNQEFLLANLPPPSKFKQLDLLKTTRKQFRFPSNKLDYVVQQLGLGQKTHHKGMEMWHDCMNGCQKAWATMKRYNIQDVRLLEKYYLVLLPWITNHPNWGVYLDSERPTCRNCGSEKVVKNGRETTNTYIYQRYMCKDCGAPLRGRKSLKRAPEGLTM